MYQMQHVIEAFGVVNMLRMGSDAENLCLETLLLQLGRLNIDFELFDLSRSNYPAIQTCQVIVNFLSDSLHAIGMLLDVFPLNAEHCKCRRMLAI
jgi:hypothetical protein